MDKNRKKGVHSLYVYLTMSFIFILIIVIVSTVLYFGLLKKYIFNTDTHVVKDIIDETIQNNEIKQEIESGVINATVYGLIVGVALILVIASHIIKPIRKINEATKKVASGDLKTKVDIHRNDELGRLADNFNLMVKELNSIEYLRKDYISNVSHELKTPIASIQGFAKLLNDESISEEERKEYTKIIIEETTRLSNLSNNIMKLSKIENQTTTTKTTYRLDEQIRKVIIMLQEELEKKSITINLKSKEITINEDSDLLMEVWINLLNNSIKYTNPNGKIDVEIIENENNITVKIKDNGIGIPKDKQTRIFEKFYQADRSHKYDGNGLGLAIVKKIIELIDGKILFTSEVGKETTFEVILRK